MIMKISVRADPGDALDGRRVGFVGDEHARGLAVRCEEHLQPALEVGVLERFRRQIEQVVVLGLIEGGTQRQRGVVGGLRLVEQDLLRVVRRQRQVPALLHARDGLRKKCRQLRSEVRQLVGVALHRSRLVGQFVDPVEGVEEGTYREAHGDVVAVRFPIEVGAQWPELVIEVCDVVSQFLGGREQIPRLGR
jgi:hypothetical protein